MLGLTPKYLCSESEKRRTSYNPKDSEYRLNVPSPHIALVIVALCFEQPSQTSKISRVREVV